MSALNDLPDSATAGVVLASKIPESEEDRLWQKFYSDLAKIEQEYFEKGAPQAAYNNALEELDKRHEDQGVALKERQSAEKNALQQAWMPALSTDDPLDKEYRSKQDNRLEQLRSDLKAAATRRRKKTLDALQ